jgi:hypothetical protein
MNIPITYKFTARISLITLLLVCSVFVQTLSVALAQAQTPTVAVHLEKKFSGQVPVGYTPDMFSFKVSGSSFPEQTVNLVNGNDGTADGTINLPIGIYTVKEVGPTGFIEGEWRPGWYGGTECAGGSDFQTTLTITENSIERMNIDCQVDNQWRFGTLRVVKEFASTTVPVAFENFGFKVTQGAQVKYDGTFDTDGDNMIVVGEGAYSVVETAHTGYTPSYSAGCSGTMGFEGNKTCTITNTYTSPVYTQSSYGGGYSQSSYGGGYSQSAYGGGGSQTYLVYGYVWHDKNESDIWEKSEPNPADNEVDLDGWTVQITNGTNSYSTTTDTVGYYYFNVPAGTWTISEVLQTTWSQTFPNATTHTVNVVAPALTKVPEQNFFAMIAEYVFELAFAQALTTYGPYDFGNVFATGNGYSQGSYGGGSYNQGSYGNGSYSQGSYGGGGNGGRGGSSGGSSNNNSPVPQVLGEATTAIPLGAPDTGAGGTAPLLPTLPTLYAIMTGGVERWKK